MPAQKTRTSCVGAVMMLWSMVVRGGVSNNAVRNIAASCWAATAARPVASGMAYALMAFPTPPPSAAVVGGGDDDDEAVTVFRYFALRATC